MTTVVLNIISTEIENEKLDTISFISTAEFNRLTKISFDARMKQEAKILVKTSFLSYFNGRRYFGDNQSQNCLIFHPISNISEYQLVILGQL